MKKTILLDLDDTLIETTFRQYKVISFFFNTNGVKLSEFADYVSFRKTHKCSNMEYVNQYVSDPEILKQFKTYYTESIEKVENLKLDKFIVNYDLLVKISNKFDLILVSLRSNNDNSINQLKSLKIYSFFKKVHFIKHDLDNPKTKIISMLKNNEDILTFSGDSLSDFEAAKAAKVDFVGVESGLFGLEGNFRKFETINEYFNTLINE